MSRAKQIIDGIEDLQEAMSVKDLEGIGSKIKGVSLSGTGRNSYSREFDIDAHKDLAARITIGTKGKVYISVENVEIDDGSPPLSKNLTWKSPDDIPKIMDAEIKIIKAAGNDLNKLKSQGYK